MYEHLNVKLAELKEDGRNEAKWQMRLEQLKRELAEQERNRNELQEMIEAEEREVERLTSVSVQSIFYTVLGKKSERLNREQSEVQELKAKYEEVLSNVHHLEDQIDELVGNLRNVRNWHNNYDKLIHEKESLIVQDHEELQALVGRQTELSIQLKEVGEAVQAGRAVRYDLNCAQESLRSASNWGTYDLLGGGMVATHVKHNHVDEASEHIQKAQSSLRRFEKELSDVQTTVPIQLDIAGILKFSDYFFDGIIADWLVQGQINDTLDQVVHKQSLVSRILEKLETENNKLETERNTIKRQYNSLVEQA